MGLDIAHDLIMLLFLGTLIRTATYLIIARNPESPVGKYLAYAF